MAKRATFLPPASPDPAEIAPTTAETIGPDDVDALRAVLPAHEQNAPGVGLFVDACLTYGINPSDDAAPVEIPTIDGVVRPRWTHYPTNQRVLNAKPERIVFVTAGGTKVVHPMNEDFERTVRRLLGAFHIDPTTRELVEDPLPADLTLPRQAITGEVLSAKHQYRAGYLRARSDAART